MDGRRNHTVSLDRLSVARRAVRLSRRLAANRSMAKACARPAGQNSPSSQNPIARGSGLPSSTIRDRNCSRWRRSPIRRPMIAAAPRCAMTISRTLVHALKDQDRTDLAPAAGWRAREELLANADMLIAVPLRWRRVSAAATTSPACSRATARQIGVALAGMVLRRGTEQQVGFSRAQRASNVQGAFQVSAGRQGDVAGRRVVWSMTS
jgi:predicted amidophosphoribosyltransferase